MGEKTKKFFPSHPTSRPSSPGTTTIPLEVLYTYTNISYGGKKNLLHLEEKNLPHLTANFVKASETSKD